MSLYDSRVPDEYRYYFRYQNNAIGVHKGAKESSLHPPHLINSNGSLTPAALIPFCAYQANMTLLGQTRQDLPFTVCDKFQPTVLEGQLCYSIDLKLTNSVTKEGLQNGLVFILDQGVTEITEDRQSMHTNEDMTMSMSFEPQSKEQDSARIYLNTLSSFHDFRSGKYAMSVLKKIKGTASFLEIPDENKNCMIEAFEDCQSREYIKEVQKECGCVPWALSSAVKEPTVCSPAAFGCYTQVSSNFHGCLVSCTGLYADVQFTPDDKLNFAQKTSDTEDIRKNIEILASAGWFQFKVSILRFDTKFVIFTAFIQVSLTDLCQQLLRRA